MTEPVPLKESTSSPVDLVQLHRRERSSAGERLLHTQDVTGSIPVVPTVPDNLADMLADDAWRMDVETRFWPKVMKPLGWDECWPWSGARKSSRPTQAYGHFKLASYMTVGAHRLSFALYTGRSPGDLCVCHRCDNPICVNPTHLFLGTQQDNTADKMAKGRHRSGDHSGEKNPGAKLSADQVETIKTLIGNGLTNVAIGRRFGVTHQLVSKIRRGRAWGAEAMQPKYASLRLTPSPT